MFHANPATLDGGVLRTDRKFVSGMQRYAQEIDARLVTVHRRLMSGEQVMDPVSVDVDELPYRVVVVDADWAWHPAAHEVKRVHDVVASSDLVVHGFFNVGPIAARLGVPEVLVAEFDRQTTIVEATIGSSNPLARLVRGTRAWRQHQGLLPSARRAMSMHCNGYPVHDELSRLTPRCMLFLDSRMGDDDVIDAAALERRIESRAGRPLRLIYSGRYEPMKGALDAVRAAQAALSQGADIELHCYGQGVDAGAMREAAASSAGRIQVHDAVPFPELMDVARGFDLFVCCHVQSDPSCTYIESFGAGLPVVGYGNRMWAGLQRDSGVGRVTPMRDVQAVACGVMAYASDPLLLARHSRAARRFALAHSFEREFDKRTRDLTRCLAASTAFSRRARAA